MAERYGEKKKKHQNFGLREKCLYRRKLKVLIKDNFII